MLRKQTSDQDAADWFIFNDTTNVGQNYDTLRQQAGQVVELIERSVPQYFPKPLTK